MSSQSPSHPCNQTAVSFISSRRADEAEDNGNSLCRSRLSFSARGAFRGEDEESCASAAIASSFFDKDNEDEDETDILSSPLRRKRRYDDSEDLSKTIVDDENSPPNTPSKRKARRCVNDEDYSPARFLTTKKTFIGDFDVNDNYDSDHGDNDDEDDDPFMDNAVDPITAVVPIPADDNDGPIMDDADIPIRAARVVMQRSNNDVNENDNDDDDDDDPFMDDAVDPAMALLAATAESESAAQNSHEISWNNHTYHLRNLPKLPLEEALQGLDTRLARCEVDSPQVQMIRRCGRMFLRKVYKSIEFQPRDLIVSQEHDPKGIYGVAYRPRDILVPNEGLPERFMEWLLKFGMSLVSKFNRVKQQGKRFAFNLADLKDLRESAPQDVCNELADAEFPGTYFHEDHREHFLDLLVTQLYEMTYICCFPCVSTTILERFTQRESDAIRHILRPVEFAPQAINFLCEDPVPDQSVFCCFTWITNPDTLKRQMENPQTPLEDRELLHRCLHPNPKDGFVERHLAKQLFGIKFYRDENAVNKCPRAVQVEDLTEMLRPLLEAAVDDPTLAERRDQIQEMLQTLKGDNYSSYVHPSKTELAAGAKLLLQVTMDKLPTNWIVHIERVTVAALEECELDWFESVFDMSKAMDLLPHNPRALCLVRAKTGHRTIITLSFFIMYAENVPLKSRLRAVEAYQATLQLWQQSGNCTAEHVLHCKKLLRSFLMSLEFGKKEALLQRVNGQFSTSNGSVDDDNQGDVNADGDDDGDADGDDDGNHHGGFTKARRLAMPDDFFKGPKAGSILTVSRNLGIGYTETLTLRLLLGPLLFGRLLKAHGLPAVAPFEPNFECNGVVAFGHHESTPCCSQGDYSAGVCMMKKEDHPCNGQWLCKRCYDVAWNRFYIVRQIEEHGIDTVRAEYRRKFINHQANERVMATQGDATATERINNRREYFQKWHQKQQEKGVVSRTTGSKWKRKHEKWRYPEPVATLLSTALLHWITVYNRVRIIWPDVVALFRDVCEIESSAYTNHPEENVREMFRIYEGEMLWYSAHYEEIGEMYLHRPILVGNQAFGKTWTVKPQYLPANPVSHVLSKEQKAQLRHQVLDLVYPAAVE